jgi:prolyl oligopeptidase
MPTLLSSLPHSDIEPVTEVLNGISVTDPYRWLEDQDSPRTRVWIEEQTRYARAYLDSITGRDRIRKRVRELLAVETYDSLQKVGNRYFFRKRLPNQEQPCIYMREGTEGKDQLLINPAHRLTGPYTSVKPIQASADGRLLLYEVKEGGERCGAFELFDLDTRDRLPDSLPRGYLSGFGFGSDGRSFYYVHEPISALHPVPRTAYHHRLGTLPSNDRVLFHAGEGDNIRLTFVGNSEQLICLVYRFLEKTLLDVYSMPTGGADEARPLFLNLDCTLDLRLLEGRIVARTNRGAPNSKIVEIRLHDDGEHDWLDLVPESTVPIQQWLLADNRILVSYVDSTGQRILSYALDGSKEVRELPMQQDETVRMVWGGLESDELILELETFTHPATTISCSSCGQRRRRWGKGGQGLDPHEFVHKQTCYKSTDGTTIPMSLVGRDTVVAGGAHPTILTSYGGYGVCMTPRFSALVALLMEYGCLFALPSIRGGSEFGHQWHSAAKRRNKQRTYDDFICAAQSLIETGRTSAAQLAIFGGSNSGLLVGVALTQRPDLFRAVLCIAPMLDMLRYHLFDQAHVLLDEFGTADNPKDLTALLGYSPYFRVRDGMNYPATMIVSGDADQNCNPLHARKMSARLQAATASTRPILLDYHPLRGHSPVLPLSTRIEALTDRVAFLCDQLGL